jgi:3-hydroxyacyl-[acyl-carrier-protein] dehydratase
VSAPTPLDGEVRLLAHDTAGAVGEYRVLADETVLAGHFPGFPIFPGVCLVECAHRTALAVAEARGSRVALSAVQSTRFLAPVFPGDRLTVRLGILAGAEDWACTARLERGEDPVATVRLRYALGGSE